MPSLVNAMAVYVVDEKIKIKKTIAKCNEK